MGVDCNCTNIREEMERNVARAPPSTCIRGTLELGRLGSVVIGHSDLLFTAQREIRVWFLKPVVGHPSYQFRNRDRRSDAKFFAHNFSFYNKRQPNVSHSNSRTHR